MKTQSVAMLCVALFLGFVCHGLLVGPNLVAHAAPDSAPQTTPVYPKNAQVHSINAYTVDGLKSEIAKLRWRQILNIQAYFDGAKNRHCAVVVTLK